MMPCPGCRLVHYCNEECQERDRARHSVECGTLAVKSFRLLSSALAGILPDLIGRKEGRKGTSLTRVCLLQAGPGVSLMRWIDEATDFVTEFHMLPDELTSKQVRTTREWRLLCYAVVTATSTLVFGAREQVEELFARAVVAFCHLTTHDHNARYIK